MEVSVFYSGKKAKGAKLDTFNQVVMCNICNIQYFNMNIGESNKINISVEKVSQFNTLSVLNSQDLRSPHVWKQKPTGWNVSLCSQAAWPRLGAPERPAKNRALHGYALKPSRRREPKFAEQQHFWMQKMAEGLNQLWIANSYDINICKELFSSRTNDIIQNWFILFHWPSQSL